MEGSVKFPDMSEFTMAASRLCRTPILIYLCQKVIVVNFTDRINASAKLGDILKNPDADRYHSIRKEMDELNALVETSHLHNGWFTRDNVRFALHSLGKSLERLKIEKWLDRYPEKIFDQEGDKTIGVVMAGNIPLVGFQDYLCVMVTGNKFLGKLSSNDNKLLPLIHRIFEKLEPGFKNKATFTEDKLEGFEAIIATGSNNTARYFEYYFGKYPRIIRKNRNGVAVLNGDETPEKLTALGEDIFRYYGLGCRNVSKIFVPEGYKFDALFRALEQYAEVAANHKYINNYDYNKSIYLVNKTEHFDNGFLILKEDATLASPVAVVHFEYYNDPDQLNHELAQNKKQIQCIVSTDKRINDAIAPGKSQQPQLWDYADNVDTIDFLMGLS